MMQMRLHFLNIDLENWPSDKQTVIFLTVGTGIGSSIWVGDRLLPNSELGHLRVRRKLKFEEYCIQ